MKHLTEETVAVRKSLIQATIKSDNETKKRQQIELVAKKEITETEMKLNKKWKTDLEQSKIAARKKEENLME